MASHDTPKVTLPDIQLNELPESTKDFLIAASGGRPITEVVRDVLNAAAARCLDPKKVA